MTPARPPRQAGREAWGLLSLETGLPLLALVDSASITPGPVWKERTRHHSVSGNVDRVQ